MSYPRKSQSVNSLLRKSKQPDGDGAEEQKTSRNKIVDGKERKEAHEEEENAADKERPCVRLGKTSFQFLSRRLAWNFAADQRLGDGVCSCKEGVNFIALQALYSECREEFFRLRSQRITSERKFLFPKFSNEFRNHVCPKRIQREDGYDRNSFDPEVLAFTVRLFAVL